MTYKRISVVLQWISVLALQAVVLAPILITPLVGDDLITPFDQFRVTGPNIGEVWNFAVENGTGHKFNLIGHIIWAFHLHSWLYFDSFFGVNHHMYYFLTKQVIFSLAILSAAHLLQTIFTFSTKGERRRREIPLIVSFVIVLIGFGSIAQIHALWSNDPVANYPMSGYAAAAVGLYSLTRAFNYLIDATKKNAAAVGAMSVVAILYYEINVALLPAFIWLLIIFRNEMRRNTEFKGSHILLILIPPILVIGIGRLITYSDSGNYGGTTFGSFKPFLHSIFVGVGSSLPTGSWIITRELIPTLSLKYWQMGLIAMILGVFVFILSAIKLRFTHALNIQGHVAFLSLLSLFFYSFFALAIQASTDKYQNELTRVGNVYNFYSIASLSFSVLFAVLFIFSLQKSQNWSLFMIPGVVVIASIQLTLNWNISGSLNSNYLPSNSLISSFGETTTDTDRCRSWHEWAARDWPDYYEEGLGTGLDLASKHFFNHEFCSTGVAKIE